MRAINMVGKQFGWLIVEEFAFDQERAASPRAFSRRVF